MNLRLFQRLLRDQSGAAAIELAMVAPVIAGLAVMSFGIWQTGSENQDARAALDVGVEYYMSGGTNDDVAKTLVRDAWRHRPGDAAVNASRSYRCGETAAQSTTVCTGGRSVATYVTLLATGGGSEDHDISEQRVVRVR